RRSATSGRDDNGVMRRSRPGRSRVVSECMKLAFSTLGVPGLPLADVLGLATAHGYHGVELRAHPEEPVHPGLTPAQRADVATDFKSAGVEVLGLAGYVRVAAPGEDDAVIGE